MINNDIYYKKYLKYKSKYAELKGQIGGECPESNEEYTKAQLIKIGCTKDKFDISSITKEEIDAYNNDNGNSDKITLADLIKADFLDNELIALGFTVEDIREGKKIEFYTQLINTDYDTKNIINILKQIKKKVLFDNNDIFTSFDFTANNLKKSKFTATELKDAGLNKETLIRLNITATELIKAGFTINDLITFGFTATELKTFGFSLLEIYNAIQSFKTTISLIDLLALYTINEIKDAGLNKVTLIRSNITARKLNEVGFTIKDLKTFGFTCKELKEAGFILRRLKDEGFFKVKELKEAGFTLEQLTKVYFTIKDLKDAGFTLKELLDAGFDLHTFVNADFPISDFIAIGIAEDKLISAGFNKEKVEACILARAQEYIHI